MKMFTTLRKTAIFLKTTGNLYKAFSVYGKTGGYELQSLQSACDLVDQSFKLLKLFETNVRNHLQKPCKNLEWPAWINIFEVAFKKSIYIIQL